MFSSSMSTAIVRKFVPIGNCWQEEKLLGIHWARKLYRGVFFFFWKLLGKRIIQRCCLFSCAPRLRVTVKALFGIGNRFKCIGLNCCSPRTVVKEQMYHLGNWQNILKCLATIRLFHQSINMNIGLSVDNMHLNMEKSQRRSMKRTITNSFGFTWTSEFSLVWDSADMNN